MGKIKKIMIYPFDRESLPVVKYTQLLEDGDILYAISPNGWGTVGKDASYVSDSNEIGLIIDNDFDKALEKADIIFFNEPSVTMDFNSFIYPKIIKAAKCAKDIICTIQLKDKIVKEVEKTCNDNNKTFKYFKKDDKIDIEPDGEKIYNLDTPVVFVSGLAERTNKFEIQLGLRKNLLDEGYKVSQIGTRNYCELMGFHSFPQFMYSKSIAEAEKVVLFNHYIKNIEMQEKPDVIVIGIPGGIMPFDNEFTNKFGILAFEVSQAIIPDFAVMSTLYNDVKPEFFELLLKSCKYKLGYEIDCFNIANISINYGESMASKLLSYVDIDFDFINENKKTYNCLSIPVYNLLDKKDLYDMTNFLIDKLNEYSETQYV